MLVLMTAVLVHEQPLTLVVMPDIQYYTDLRLQLFRLYWDPPTDNLTHVYTQQLQWVVSTQHRLNTRAVIFMGDLTQADAPEEWAAVRKGLRKLEAARPPVPYCLLQGDHDLGYEYTGVPPFMARKAAHRRSQVDGNVNSAVTAQPHWRGAFQSEHPVANSWYELSTNSPLAPMLVICLEYRPRDSALQWAAGVLRSHPRHDAIVVTHDYLNAKSGARSDYSHLNTAQAGTEATPFAGAMASSSSK
jgi:predicted MPP superfamily phosphohydrolase